MASNRTVHCEICNRDIDLRSAQFGHITLSNHIKREH